MADQDYGAPPAAHLTPNRRRCCSTLYDALSTRTHQSWNGKTRTLYERTMPARGTYSTGPVSTVLCAVIVALSISHGPQVVPANHAYDRLNPASVTSATGTEQHSKPVIFHRQLVPSNYPCCFFERGCPPPQPPMQSERFSIYEFCSM